jgi:DNA topoisomerase-1
VDVGAGPEGLITYMRTDSVRVEPEFARSARGHIQSAFGAEYLPPKPREYRSKKSAQDAHEAIRPTNLAYTPERVKSSLSADQLKVYTLVYNRFLASQMANAVLSQRQVDLVSTGGDLSAKFRRTGTQVVFDGFLRLYREEDANGEEQANGAEQLARINEGMPARLVSLEAAQHFTKPPARYTEASLIKVLEENGIGRPSTYSPIIETIVDRGYIVREGRSLTPTEWAFVVTELMKDYFPEVVDVDFTARMEERLDEVEEGKGRWQELVAGFYEPLARQIEQAIADKKSYRPAPVVLDEQCPDCGKPLVVRDGRFGKFTACSGYPECRYVKREDKGANNNAEPVEGVCPKCGAALVARRNRWGSQFVACTAFPKCDFTREPQDICPKCGGKLLRLQAKNRRVFYACEHNQRDGEGAGAGSCDFVLWGRPTVEKCELCGWFIAEKKLRGNSVTFCANPACANHRGHEPENESE